MTAEVINLRRARKAKSRAEKESAAAENRQSFGRTKSEKEAEAAQRLRAKKHLEGHRRDPTSRDR